MLRRTGSTAVQFRQTIDEIMIVTLDTIIHREVDDLQIFRHVVAFHKFLRVAVGSTEEKHVDSVQG